MRWRFFGSLVLMGMLVGMMIGRLTAPGPIRLEAVEPHPQGLVLWLDREPTVRDEAVQGTYALHVAAGAEAAEGQLRLGDTLVNWRLRPEGQMFTLGFVAARPLHGRWHGGEDADGRWGLVVTLVPAGR